MHCEAIAQSAACAALELPIIIIMVDDPNLLQQMSLIEQGAQDYLVKRRLDADTLSRVVRSAIASKSRERSLFFACPLLSACRKRRLGMVRESNRKYAPNTR